MAESAAARPDNVAMMLIEAEGARTFTFSSMLDQVRSIAYRLSKEQIEFGDRVAVIGENHPHWAIAYLGIIYRGAVVTPLDPAATVSTMAAFLKDSETKLAFVSPASLEKFRAACEQLGKSIPAVALRPLSERNGLADFEDWAQTPLSAEFLATPPPAKSDDLALLMYTSGTTGVPKAVQLTHGNIYAESDKIQEVMQVSDREVLLSLLPLFHVYSQIVNLWLGTIIGAKVIYLAELSSEEIERGLKEGGATALMGVPRLWYLFHKKIFDAVRSQPALVRILFRVMLVVNGWLRNLTGFNAGRLFFGRVHQSFGGNLRLAVSAGASFDADVARDFHRLGFTILQGYGLTETSGAATVTRFEDNKIGSVGTPLNGVEVKIDEPNDLGVGEVLIRGPVVSPGYYRNPEANREAFTHDRWFRSGDLGHFDRDGHLYIVGRKKDVIKLPSGKNVFPEDVEAHYEQSPFVSEVCVLGVHDESSEFKGAEKLCAVVVPDFDHLKAQHIANAREWIVWEMENLGRELPEYQRVHDFVLRAESLPRTSTRKLRRFELKDQIKTTTHSARAAKDIVLTPADHTLMDSPVGKAVANVIAGHAPETKVIHPRMNLEIDLGLDSLARAECITALERVLNIEFSPEAAARAHTVGELIELANTMSPSEKSSLVNQELSWHELLNTPSDLPEVQALNKRKTVMGPLIYLMLIPAHIIARLLFRMEVKGSEVLSQLKPPFLICPNHQSYIDPILVCSNYPLNVLRNTFHVGATMYFSNAFMSRLARLINIVPIDPDVQLLRAMRAGATGLRAGKILNIYPEGTRSIDHELLEFKKGAAIIATEMNLPIVPVALDGMYRIWPRKSWRFRLAKVKIRFGEPIYAREAFADENTHELIYEKVTALLKNRIQEMLDQMRGET